MTDNEFERTARAWLDDGPNQISDRAVQSALDQIHVTRQRRSWGSGSRCSLGEALREALAAHRQPPLHCPRRSHLS